MLALEKAANCTPVNIGSGQAITIRELVNTIIQFTPYHPSVVWDVGKQTGESIRVMDMTRARSVLGFEPKVSLSDGIEKTVEWYLSHKDAVDQRYSVFREDHRSYSLIEG